VALFVLILVGVVVAQTWLDWRDTLKQWVFPNWAKGTALAGVIAASLTAITSFTSVLLQEPTSQPTGETVSKLFWPELAFLLCMMGVIVVSVRKKRMRLMLLLVAMVMGAFWLGVMLSS
jgi:lipopolysaccharide export LptBFGC system permease protein LptF